MWLRASLVATLNKIWYLNEVCERRRWLRWRRCPKSMSALERDEQKLFSNLKTKTYCTHVNVGEEHRIRTLRTTPPNERVKTANPIPIVCLHGMGAAIGFWALNIDDLARHRPFFAMDLLGFGNSSRSSFPDDPNEAEQQFIDTIEDWCEELGLKQFILLGHSFGGYLATAFSIKYPRRIKRLILVDPWGFPRKPDNLEERYNINPVKRAVLKIMLKFSPLAAMRALGPLGPCLMKKVRPDLKLKFQSVVEGDVLYQYIYHCNSKTPASGEYAFMKINDTLGWSKFPLMNRIGDLDSSIRITFIYGEDSWMDHDYADSLKARRQGKVDIKCVSDAGHHVYADNPSIFNMLVNKACTRTDMEEGHGLNQDMERN
ncbi:(Lyso)-N-acylphosphatidylethanolamine lipase-like isoform X2 [Lineus longissimus]|uniref:(Lyso)-N-acylphosphatidylethanolamine lipase-like isoform X2 n=1 Tax=Lineus longissimus TaxID=88925 RepID=UPI002B4E32EB